MALILQTHALLTRIEVVNLDPPHEEDLMNSLRYFLLFVLAVHYSPAQGNASEVFIRIFKADRLLEVWAKDKENYKLMKAFSICYFSGRLGPKKRVGDQQAPEGIYEIQQSSLNPNSAYYLSMNVGYPNEYDRFHKRTGSHIMIHGDCVSVGCFAMTDSGVKEIYQIVEGSLRSGQKTVPVHIFPFRMTWVNMFRYIRFSERPFWKELQLIYEAFEDTKIPPKVVVRNGRYEISGAQ